MRVCVFLFYALSGLIMPTMRTLTPARPTHTYLFVCIWFVMLPLIVVLRVIVKQNEMRSFSMASGQIFNLFCDGLLVWPCELHGNWIAICPKLMLNTKPKGIRCTTQQHRANGQISYSLNLHITNIVNQIDCDDSLVLTPSISHWSCSTWKILTIEIKLTAHTHNNNNNKNKRATPTIHKQIYSVCARCAWKFESMPNTQFIFMDQTEKSLLITLDKYYN